MAVYTKVSEEELSAFVSSYGIGSVLHFRGIAEGIENTNYKLSTDTGQYILTLYEKRVDSCELPYFLRLMEYLSGRAIPCPLPLHARDGSLYSNLCERPAAIFTFLPGRWPRKGSAQHCYELGVWLARLHKAGEGFSGFRKNDLSLSSWRALLESCDRQAANELSNGLYEELCAELDYLERRWPDDLPIGTIHADLFPDNVFFSGGKISGMIDFYFACNDACAYDLSVCLNAWCFDAENCFEAIKAGQMLKGYCGERQLERGELDALPILARGSALRFLLTRLYDWGNTPDDALVARKDPLEFLLKLRFHQQIRKFGNYGLEISR